MKQQLYGPKGPVIFDPPYNDSACQQPRRWTVRQAQMRQFCAREPGKHIPHGGRSGCSLRQRLRINVHTSLDHADGRTLIIGCAATMGCASVTAFAGPTGLYSAA